MAMSPKTSYDTDVVRLIGQHLVSLGFKRTADVLLEESGLNDLDHPIATKFQQNILSGEWDKANSMVEDIANLIVSDRASTQQIQFASNGDTHSSSSSLSDSHMQVHPHLEKNKISNSQHKSIIKEMRLAIAEQKFLELIEDNSHIRALRCLRTEITPWSDDMQHVQFLSTLLLCKSVDELKLKADWTGKGRQSRQLLIGRLQRFIPPWLLLPPKRLDTLLHQAIQLQTEHCALHLDDHLDDDGYVQYDLKSDHVCSANKFPLRTRQESDSHKSEVWFCRFSHDGMKLATGGLDGKVKIWNLDPVERKLIEKCTLDCNSCSITCLSWSPNDVYLLACGSEDKPDLWIWNVNKEEVHNKIILPEGESTTTCSWHMSGEKFAAASIRGNFTIYDLDGNRRGNREGVRVQCLHFPHTNPNHVLAADTLNRIRLYATTDMSLKTEEEDVLEEQHSIISFTIDRADKYVAVNLMEQGVNLWDYKSKTLLRTFSGVCQRYMAIYSSFSSPGSKFLASGSEDGKIYIYHLLRNEPVAILYGHSRCVNCVSWNPKYPELLVSASDDRFVKLWSPTDETVANIDSHN